MNESLKQARTYDPAPEAAAVRSLSIHNKYIAAVCVASTKDDHVNNNDHWWSVPHC